MSTASYPLRDSATMLRRNLRHALRYPALTVSTVAMPLVFLLLFVYVLGDTLGAGLAGVSGGRAEYLDYVTPGILLITVAAAVPSTAISVATDMTEGIINRFRTMAIARVSVLTGHVVGSVIQTMLAVAAVTGLALLLGLRTDADPVEWLAATGLLIATTFALVWLAVALGLKAKTVESASNLPLLLVLLPFFGSGFVPTESLPTGVRWFAEYQPFTPVMETLRGLLMGSAIGSSGLIAVSWCAAIALVGYLWSRRLFNRDPALAAA